MSLLDDITEVTATYGTGLKILSPKEELELVQYLKDTGFILIGSRRYIAESNSDWDFIARDSQKVREILYNQGFTLSFDHTFVKPEQNYCDVATSAIFKISNIDISLKFPSMYDKVCQLWNMVTPETYEKYFWKSSTKYPKTKDQVQERINMFLEIL